MSEYTALHLQDNESATPFIKLSEKQRKVANRDFLTALGAVFLFAALVGLGAWYTTNGGFHEESQELPPIFPDFRRVPRVFQPNFTTWNLTDIDSTKIWADIIPRGHVVVEQPERYGLKPGIPLSPDADRMVIAGFHQIHCLRLIRDTFVTIMTGKYIPGPHPYNSHPDHCFDYLLQSIQCNLDLTLESAVVDYDGKRRKTVGWGTEHQCIDWSQVMDFVHKDWRREKSHKEWKKAYDSEPLPPEKMDALPTCSFPKEL